MLTIEQALRPLGELLVSAQLGIGDLIAISKMALVQGAIAKARHEPGHKLNLTHIGVETGLSRNDVAALLKQPAGQPLPFRRGRVRAERVLSGWWTDEDFLDDNGRPTPLKTRGAAPSFVALAQRYGGAGRAQPILEELLRAEAIEKRAYGRYHVRRRTLLNVAWDKESLAELGTQLRQLGEALLHNLNHPEEPQFTRYFQSVPLDPTHAAVLMRDLQRDGALFFESSSDRLGAKLYAAAPSATPKQTRRLAIGVQVLEITPPESRPPVRAKL